jgi:hypothetical protein
MKAIDTNQNQSSDTDTKQTIKRAILDILYCKQKTSQQQKQSRMSKRTKSAIY